MALLAAALIVRQPPSSTWAVVALPDGSVQGTVSDEFDQPEALVAQLRAHGIEVAVLPVTPSSPDLVGQVDFAGPSEDQPGLEVRSTRRGGRRWRRRSGRRWGRRGATEFVIDPAVFTGTIELEMAAKGATIADAFAPGEVLHGLPCSPDDPLSPDEVEDAARDTGVEVLWRVVEADGTLRPASTRPQGRVHLATVSRSAQPRIAVLEVAVLPPDVDPTAAPEDGCTGGAQ